MSRIAEHAADVTVPEDSKKDDIIEGEESGSTRSALTKMLWLSLIERKDNSSHNFLWEQKNVCDVER